MDTSKDVKTTSSRLHRKKSPTLREEQKTPQLPEQQIQRFRLMPLILMIVILLLLGGSFYLIKANRSLHQSLDQQLKLVQSQIAELDQQQTDTKTQFDHVAKETQQKHATLENRLNTVDKNLQSAVQQHLYQTKDWLLFKVRYYLELAQINTQWSDNSQTTIALLQQANELLASAHDSRTLNIRQAIAEEIVQIKAIPSFDMAGVLSQLDGSMSLIDKLPLKSVVMPESKEKVLPPESGTAQTWRESLQRSISLLKELVVIRRQTEAIHPLPSPAYEFNVRESIHLNLQQAQWAILQNNEKLYQFFLNQALDSIHRLFANNADVTKTLIQELQNLQKLQFSQQKPHLEKSLSLLNQLIESKDTQPSKGDQSE